MTPKKMSKKEFKELASIHVYGSGERRRVALYFDWKQGELPNGGYFAGYSKMVKGYGCTQANILRDAYEFFINENFEDLCWYDLKTVDNDSDRFKVSLVG